ncbi:unnamed protein product, partial [Cyprideis torosa]
FCQELQAKTEAAEKKLNQMMEDQKEAEKKKTQSQQIQAKLTEKKKLIAVKKEQVMTDLAQVEPAVDDAKQGERNTREEHHHPRGRVKRRGCVDLDF